MGTRSMIAIQNPITKTVKAVYCHWNGSLEHNGAILNEHYGNSPKVNHLIAMGDLSSLRPEIGDKHEFSRLDTELTDKEWEELYGDMCTFYTRDRGETAPYKKFETTADAVEHYTGAWCEYFYVFKYDEDLETGKWYYKTRTGGWKSVAQALNKLAKEEEVCSS